MTCMDVFVQKMTIKVILGNHYKKTGSMAPDCHNKSLFLTLSEIASYWKKV